MPTGQSLIIREARPVEFAPLGELLVQAYSELEGFPGPAEQPRYYEMLAHVGALVERPGVRLLVAVAAGELIGGTVFFADMAEYASGGSATSVRDASGMRLLAVSSEHRGTGAGKALTRACIAAARAQRRAAMILHTTAPMRVAWQMYLRLGFTRAQELDFLQEGLPVFGFSLRLD